MYGMQTARSNGERSMIRLNIAMFSPRHLDLRYLMLTLPPRLILSRGKVRAGRRILFLLKQLIEERWTPPFPFLWPVVPEKYGKVHEFRTYHLKPGGLPPKNAPEQFYQATSTIGPPTAASPLA